MSEWQPLEAGTVIRERYEVESLLGKGGFGATYRAKDRERFDQPCALKELLPAKATNPKVLELFEREARILLALRHPGIPALHAYFTEDSRYYLVQDYVGGSTLAQIVEQRGALPEAEVVLIVRDALTILQYLHGRAPAVIHRDLKPTNMIRGDSGRLYLIDFGAVKEALGQPTTDPESTVIKSAGYTPPEQARGVVVPASDLYALGATALNLITGRHPFDWYDALSGQWQFAGRINASRRLESVLGRLLEESLPRRLASATEALAALSAGGPATDVNPATQIELTPPPPAREGALVPGAVLRGRYEVLSVLHDDPSSTTYRAADRESFGRPCLLIELRLSAETETRVRAAFEREARRLAALSHPALPRVLAFFPDGGRYYVIQEVVEGETLAERVRTRGPLSEPEVIGVLRAALDALAVIHECEPPIVHGALQPSRLVLTGPAVVMFTDFRSFRDTLAGREGVAVAPGPASPYAPPGDADAEPEPSGDLYALGGTGLFLLTGRPPTEVRGRETPPTGVSAGLHAVLERMAAPAPADRYGSARQVLAALDTLPTEAQLLPPPVPPPPVPPPAPVNGGSRGGSWLSRRNVLVAVVVGALAIGAWARSRDDTSRAPQPTRPPTTSQPAAPPQPAPNQPAVPAQPAPVQPPPAEPAPTQPSEVRPQPTEPPPSAPRRPPSAPQVAGGSPPFLGVVGLPDSVNANGRRLPALLVRSLMVNSPAQRAGMREGDLLVSIDGQPVPSAPDLLRALASHGPTSQVRLEFYSGGRPRSAMATLINSPFPEFAEGRAADPPEGAGRFLPRPDPALVQEARRSLTQSESLSVPGYGYLWVRYPEGWRVNRWGRDARMPTLIYVQAPDNLTRFDAGIMWEDAADLTPDSAFSKTFWENLRGDARGAEMLGDRVLSRTAKRYWFSQQLPAGPALSEFSLQVSTNPVITFGNGQRRTFYRWRWARLPASDQSPRTVSLLEAMRLDSGFIPAL